MKMEIERKFLVANDEWRAMTDAGQLCEQGYICSFPQSATVRVRRIGNKGFLTIKGATEGITRSELEYEIPVDEADYMLKNFCGDRVVSKTRYRVNTGEALWEIDEFLGLNQGLILAEIELENQDQTFEHPDWLGREVSLDARYFNAALSKNPFSLW